MKFPFLIIDGGLATETRPERTGPENKMVRFEKNPSDDEPAPTHGHGGLRALDDNEAYGYVPNQSLGCILDFEYNGVPARHGFLHE